MNTTYTVKSQTIQLYNGWFPCEYNESKRGIRILSLGAVDAVGQTFIKKPLSDVAREFLETLSDSRKLTVVLPQENLPQDRWPSMQVLKKELVPAPYSEACHDVR